MATQPLETIPEETETETKTPTHAPARVTADPPTTKPATAKSPGRVASGKRLAERNRLAREAKKKGATATAKTSSASAENTNSISLMTMLGICDLIVSAAGVYYQREAIMQRLKATPQAATPQAATPEAATPPAPSRIPVKRGLRKME